MEDGGSIYHQLRSLKRSEKEGEERREGKVEAHAAVAKPWRKSLGKAGIESANLDPAGTPRGVGFGCEVAIVRVLRVMQVGWKKRRQKEKV